MKPTLVVMLCLSTFADLAGAASLTDAANQVGVLGAVYAYTPACTGSTCFTGFMYYKSFASAAPIVAGIPLGTSGTFDAEGVPNSNLLVSTSGTAKAGYGVLGAEVTASVSGGPAYPLLVFVSDSYFYDDWIFDIPGSPAGTPGTAYLQFTVDGHGTVPVLSAGNNTTGMAYSGFNSGPGTDITNTSVERFSYVNNTSGTFTLESDPIPFISGQPVQVYAALDAQVSLSCVSEYPVGPDCSVWGSGATRVPLATS